MEKRDNGGQRTNTGTAAAPSGSTADTLEQRVVAFAEQLGRIVGTVQAKAEGWMDRDALNQQIASVRDGAAELLEHLSGGEKKSSSPASRSKAPAKSAKGRSGGVVDAPGKKHRKPVPNEARASATGSRIAKMKIANASRRRGR